VEDLKRLTGPTVDVLKVLFGANAPVWGLKVIKDSGRPAGTVYPALDRLEEAGWLRSRWENDSERSGPRRRYYELTADGANAAQRAIARFDARIPSSSGRPAGAQS
jgi:DNA-binding MarR family transcriptional regulator